MHETKALKNNSNSANHESNRKQGYNGLLIIYISDE